MAHTETLKPAASHGSYRRILSATSVLGGAAAMNMLISMVRAKIVAQYLGKDGLGEMGIYMSVSGLVVTVASFGLSLSGVREMAAALGAGDVAAFTAARRTLCTLSWLLGLVGAAVMAFGAYFISLRTTGTAEHTSAIAWLSLVVLLALLGNYWSALTQVAGQMTRVGKIQVAGALGGAATSVACFILWRRDGIVPALVLGAAVQALASFYWSTGLGLPTAAGHTRFSLDAARRLLTLGGLNVAVGVQTSIVAVLLRRLVVDFKGLAGVGIFQAAQGLSSLYANYILGAMSTDFLPRLAGAMHDRPQANRMINDQTVIALHLGLPGVVGTIVFAPWVVPLFYSSEFRETVPVLQVMAAAIFGRLLCWPLGMALVSANARMKWFGGEVICSVTQVLVTWLLLPRIGVMSAAVAMVVMNVVCSALYYIWVRRLTGLRWSKGVYSGLGVGTASIGAVLALTLLPAVPAFAAGIVVLLAVSWFCLREIVSSAGVTSSGVIKRLVLWRAALLRHLRPANPEPDARHS
ncbi:MAG: oligosaccharide flippase family protein [Bryobacteraceae bacterium]|nr:oligosaccharide flippase family protein [Bryobacteraceae bacterium]